MFFTGDAIVHEYELYNKGFLTHKMKSAVYDELLKRRIAKDSFIDSINDRRERVLKVLRERFAVLAADKQVPNSERCDKGLAKGGDFVRLKGANFGGNRLRSLFYPNDYGLEGFDFYRANEEDLVEIDVTDIVDLLKSFYNDSIEANRRIGIFKDELSTLLSGIHMERHYLELWPFLQEIISKYIPVPPLTSEQKDFAKLYR